MRLVLVFSLPGIAAAAAAFPAFSGDGANIPVIGLAPNGRETVKAVPRERYLQLIDQAVTDTHDSVLPVLACAQPRGAWKLHTIGVGVGISATLGLGPIFSVQAGPKIMLYYTRSHAPIFPVQ